MKLFSSPKEDLVKGYLKFTTTNILNIFYVTYIFVMKNMRKRKIIFFFQNLPILTAQWILFQFDPVQLIARSCLAYS